MNYIIYCFSADYKVFEEYLNCFKIYGIKIQKYKSKTINNISMDNFNIFIRIIPNKYINYAKCVINTEQLSDKVNYNIIANYINKNKIIVDYSNQNILFLKKKYPNYDGFFYFPYLFMKDENVKLTNFIQNNKKHDIVFCGGLNQRRTYIIDKLIEKNYDVVIVNGLWNDIRDNVIANSKILLNIHSSNEYNIFESIRCDRWIFSKMLIITENSICDDLNDMKNLLIITEYDNIVDTVIEVINNYDKYYDNIIKNYESEINTIVTNRNNLSESFIKKNII